MERPARLRKLGDPTSLLVLPLAAGLKLAAAPWILAAWLLMASRMSWLPQRYDKERAQFVAGKKGERNVLAYSQITPMR